MKTTKYILFLILSMSFNYSYAQECSINYEYGDDGLSVPDDFPKDNAEYKKSIEDFKQNSKETAEGDRVGTTVNFETVENDITLAELSLDSVVEGADVVLALIFILEGMQNAIETLSSDSASDLDKATAAVYWIPVVNIVMANIDLWTHVSKKIKATKKVNHEIHYLEHVNHYKISDKENRDLGQFMDNIRPVINQLKLEQSINKDIELVIESEKYDLILEVVKIVDSLYPIYAKKITKHNTVLGELAKIAPYMSKVGMVPNEFYTEAYITQDTKNLCRVDVNNNLITRKDQKYDGDCLFAIIDDYTKAAFAELNRQVATSPEVISNANDDKTKTISSSSDGSNDIISSSDGSNDIISSSDDTLPTLAVSSFDIVRQYIQSYNNFTKNAILRATDRLHGAVIESASRSLEVYSSEAHQLIQEAKLILRAIAEQDFKDEHNLNSQGRSLNSNCWQPIQACTSYYRYCTRVLHRPAFACGWAAMFNTEPVCYATGIRYTCDIFHYNPSNDPALVSAKNELDNTYNEILNKKNQCEQSEYKDCFANDSLKEITEIDLSVSSSDIYGLMNYAALEVFSESNSADLTIHAWGENDRLGEIGQIFAYTNRGQVEFYELISLASDSTYWYFPSFGADNGYWRYRGGVLKDIDSYTNQELFVEDDNADDKYGYDYDYIHDMLEH